MSQYARPDSDIAIGTWAPDPLYLRIDEVTPSDTDFIYNNGATLNVARIGLSNVDDPIIHTGHIVRHRALRTGTFSGVYTVSLYQGTTLIASWDRATSLTTSYQTFEETLSAGEAATITDYTALELRFGGNYDAEGDTVRVSWAELQTPDAGVVYSYTLECNSNSSGITLKDLDLIIATISDSSVISGKDFDYIIDCMSSSSTGVFVITGGVVANTYSYTIECNSQSSLNALRGLHLMLSVDSSSGGVTESGGNQFRVNSQSSVIVAGLFDPYCNSQSSVIVLLHRHLPIFVDTSSSVIQAKRPHFPINSNSLSYVVTDYELITVLVDYACYLLNEDTKRTYQFGTYEFRGIGRFNKKLIGIRNNKIYDLETVATHDDGVDISSYFEIETDFGMPNKKGFRSIFTQDDKVRVTITDRNSNAVVVDVTQDEFKALPRDLIDKAFTIKVENRDGEQITIRRLQGKLNILDIKGG